MRIKPLIPLFPALVVWSAIACAGTAEDELRQLLDEFLAGASVNDAAVHDHFWAEDLVYTSSAGERFGKARIMQGLSDSDAPTSQASPTYAARDTQIRVFDDTAVITFRLIAEMPDVEPQQYFNTGVFRRHNGQWQAIAWQATRSAAP